MRTRNLARERCGCDGMFGVRAPVGSDIDMKEVAEIFLHEFGLNMGLFESGQRNPFLPILTQGLAHPFDEFTDFHADNYYTVAPEVILPPFAQKLAAKRAQAAH